MPKDIVMTKEVAIVVSAVTKFPKLLELVNQSKEGDEIHMCEALRMMEKCSRDEGIRIGEKRGIKQEQRKNVQTMISKGFEISMIAECLSLTETQVKNYAKPVPVQ